MINNIINNLKHIPHYLLAIIIITALQLSILSLSACIPSSLIQTNMEESASYLLANDVFFNANSYDSGSRIDRYADSILLGIAYSYDNRHPITSVISSAYYHTDTANENVNLYVAVTNKYSPNLNYVRYWHGSIAIIRPLLTIFNLKQIYILNAVILTFLFLTLLINTKKVLGIAPMFCLIIAGITTSIWYVPMSLEYTWTIIIMCIASIIALHTYDKSNHFLRLFFLITGSLTAYFDFLTTETLTLMLPLALILIARYDSNINQNAKRHLKSTVCMCVFWFIGYASAWIMKWLLASIILNENIFKTAFSQAAVRINGETDSLTGLSRQLGAIIRNLSCLFPFSLIPNNGYVICILFFVLIFIIYFLIRMETCNSFANLLILIALVPYLRFLILSNHSYIHYFFTFRAQFTTIFCIGMAFVYGTDKALLEKEWRKLCKIPKKK